jgi:hypothetical protein
LVKYAGAVHVVLDVNVTVVNVSAPEVNCPNPLDDATARAAVFGISGKL